MHRQIARAELSTLQAVRDLASYLGTLPPLTEPQLGDGKQLVLGGRIYKTVCADCHGAQGEGNEADRIPAVRGQHYSYLLRQARQLASGHRYAVDIPAILVLEAMTLEQLTGVADYISRLPASDELESIADAGSGAGRLLRKPGSLRGTKAGARVAAACEGLAANNAR